MMHLARQLALGVERGGHFRAAEVLAGDAEDFDALYALEALSNERVRDELTKLINGAQPRRGVDLMVSTGLADHVLPEVPALRLEMDEPLGRARVRTLVIAATT